MGLAIATDALARFDRLSLVTRRGARAGLGGEHRSRRPSSSTDFVDYRPYQTGDDFRRVDWNVYGRLGSLQVKVTEGRERLEVVLVLDCSGSMAWDAHSTSGESSRKLQYAAQLVADLGYIALARADAVRVVLLGASQRLGPLRGRARMGELVRLLSQVAPGGQVDVQAALAACAPTPHAQSLTIVVSDLLAADGLSTAWDALLGAPGSDVVVLHVVSPDELDPHLAGEVELVDAETGAVLEIGASLDTLRAYRAQYADWLDQQQAACEGRGMRYVRLRTDQPATSAILEDLRRAGVLR